MNESVAGAEAVGAESIARLREIVAILRAPGGCPWDREQTHESIRGALIEECYEVIEAIDLGDDANLREELGDLLLHVVMHAHMASERGAFGLDEIIVEVCDKLVRRHPHVFGGSSAETTGEVLTQWEQLKRAEKPARESAIDGIPPALPALMRAQKVQKKAARVGFDWADSDGALAKVHEELAEVQNAVDGAENREIHDEIGDLFFAVVNLARKLDVDAEDALGAATQKFSRRFREVEKRIAASGDVMASMSLPELDRVWDAVKLCESGRPSDPAPDA